MPLTLQVRGAAGPGCHASSVVPTLTPQNRAHRGNPARPQAKWPVWSLRSPGPDSNVVLGSHNGQTGRCGAREASSQPACTPSATSWVRHVSLRARWSDPRAASKVSAPCAQSSLPGLGCSTSCPVLSPAPLQSGRPAVHRDMRLFTAVKHTQQKTYHHNQLSACSLEALSTYIRAVMQRCPLSVSRTPPSFPTGTLCPWNTDSPWPCLPQALEATVLLPVPVTLTIHVPRSDTVMQHVSSRAGLLYSTQCLQGGNTL